MRKYLIKIMCVFLLYTPLLAMADNTLKVGVKTSYPPNVSTVGEAIMFVLAVTDYKLAIGSPASMSADEIATRPIPPEAMHESIMPVYQAILLLIGKDSRLVVDEQHKLITFEKFRL